MCISKHYPQFEKKMTGPFWKSRLVRGRHHEPWPTFYETIWGQMKIQTCTLTSNANLNDGLLQFRQFIARQQRKLKTSISCLPSSYIPTVLFHFLHLCAVGGIHRATALCSSGATPKLSQGIGPRKSWPEGPSGDWKTECESRLLWPFKTQEVKHGGDLQQWQQSRLASAGNLTIHPFVICKASGSGAADSRELEWDFFFRNTDVAPHFVSKRSRTLFSPSDEWKLAGLIVGVLTQACPRQMGCVAATLNWLCTVPPY